MHEHVLLAFCLQLGVSQCQQNRTCNCDVQIYMHVQICHCVGCKFVEMFGCALHPPTCGGTCRVHCVCGCSKQHKVETNIRFITPRNIASGQDIMANQSWQLCEWKEGTIYAK